MQDVVFFVYRMEYKYINVYLLSLCVLAYIVLFLVGYVKPMGVTFIDIAIVVFSTHSHVRHKAHRIEMKILYSGYPIKFDVRQQR